MSKTAKPISTSFWSMTSAVGLDSRTPERAPITSLSAVRLTANDYSVDCVIIEASYDFATKSLSDPRVTPEVIAQCELFGQTRANLLLRRRRT